MALVRRFLRRRFGGASASSVATLLPPPVLSSDPFRSRALEPCGGDKVSAAAGCRFNGGGGRGRGGGEDCDNDGTTETGAGAGSSEPGSLVAPSAILPPPSLEYRGGGWRNKKGGDGTGEKGHVLKIVFLL